MDFWLDIEMEQLSMFIFLQLLIYIRSSYFHIILIYICSILYMKNNGKQIKDVLEIEDYICFISIYSVIFIIAPLV